MKKVLIVTRLLAQYRLDFVDRLKARLEAEGVALSYVYGKSGNHDALKKDEVDLEWGTYIPNKTWHLKGTELIWQPCLAHLADKDLVIVEQANRNLLNYFLIFRRLFSSKKIAYWGHGRNMQAREDDWRNKFKNLFLKQCDWWFAYTEGVKQSLVQAGYPADQVTAVQNAIDTTALAERYAAISPQEVENLREELGIFSDQVLIYCGGMYEEKRIPFLVEACDKIKERVPDLHVIMIGSGPDATLVREAAQQRPWMHYLGPKFGLDRVKYFKLATATIMPGLVGLAVLDSFAMQTPMITTTYPFHSPEIAYLEDGENGMVTDDSLPAYVRGVVQVLTDKGLQAKLLQGCRQAALRYTVDQMVENFAQGVLQALGLQNKTPKETPQEALVK